MKYQNLLRIFSVIIVSITVRVCVDKLTIGAYKTQTQFCLGTNTLK